MTAVATHQTAAGARDTLLRVLVWHWGRGGAGSKYTLELARGLAGLPDVSVVVAAASGGDLAADARAAGFVVDTVSTFEGRRATFGGRASAALAALRAPLMGLAFAATLRRHRVDVVICAMQTIWDVAALPALRATRVPFLLILHDARFRDGDRYPLRQRVLAGEVAAAHGIVALTDHVRNEALTLYRPPPERVWTVPHGAFAFPGAPRRPRRLDPRRPARLLFLGRILPYKGLALLLEAYRALRAEGSRITLGIRGDGDLGPYRAALAQLDGVNVANRWLEEAEIADGIAAADILMLPYIDASQSGVAAGALASGLPIVATPVGGLAEQVRHGVTGLVATEVSSAALAQAIRTLLSDPTLYEAMSRAALAEAEGPLGWSQVAAGIGGIAATLTGRKREVATP